MRYLGVDYGDKKIGLALGDDAIGIASPLFVLKNIGEDSIEEIKAIIKKDGIDVIVVGVPISAGSHHGVEQFEKTKAFISKLKNTVSVPVIEEDERYTTAESIRLRREQGARAEEDALAAMLILQGYFSRKNE